MVYRESFESCPRCGTALEDVGEIRACTGCRGQWVLETVLAEMVIEMVPPGTFAQLTITSVSQRVGDLACPSCGDRMDAVAMYGVDLDRCPRQHGIWFDPDELQQALANAANPQVHAAPAGVIVRPVPAGLPAREIVFGVKTEGDVYREVRVREPQIKIGRHSSCQVRVDDDRVARIHAVIEPGPVGPTIVDFGSRDGMLVNGERVARAVLASGDEIVIGATTIHVTF